MGFGKKVGRSNIGAGGESAANRQWVGGTRPSAVRASLATQQQAIQRRAAGQSKLNGTTGNVTETAARGVAAAGSQLPYESAIQAAFGHHDVSDVRTQTGGPAKAASDQLGARAYAMGSSIGFREAPDLHTAAHEAAHVVQQKAGVSLPGGVGREGDVYEQHADRVADLVVSGRSAEAELDGGPAASGRGRGSAVQREVVEERTYVVQRGDTIQEIAAQFDVTVDALVAANRSKLQEWKTQAGSVKGFNADEELAIPASDGGSSGGGLIETVIDGAKEMADSVEEAVGGVLESVTGVIGGLLDAGAELLFGEDDKVLIPGTEKGEPEAAALGQERVDHWVEIGRRCNDDKRDADKEREAFNVEQIDRWLADLLADMAKAIDPVHLRVLAGVQFQLETSKRGTTYEQAERDFDLEGTFDCSEAVQWMMRQAGLGDIFEEGTDEIATVYMSGIIKGVFGSTLRQEPRAGDIMMWGGHTGMVLDVRDDERIFLVSHMGGSGSWLNAFDLDNPNTKDSARDLLGAGQWGNGVVEGYWAPEDAQLPAPTGEATIKHEGYTPYKYFEPNTNAFLDAQYQDGEEVEVLREENEMFLVRHKGSGGAAWVRGKTIEQ